MATYWGGPPTTSSCSRCRTINGASISTITYGAAAAPNASNPCTASASSIIYASAEATTTTSDSIATTCYIPKTIWTAYPTDHNPTLLRGGHGKTETSLQSATPTLQTAAAAKVYDHAKTKDGPDWNPSTKLTSCPNNTDPYSDTNHINRHLFFCPLWNCVRI